MSVLLRPALLVLALLAPVPAAAQNLVSTGATSGLRLFMTNGNDFWLDPTGGALVFKVNGNAVSTMTPEGFWLVNGMSAVSNTGVTVSSLTATSAGASQYSIRSSSGMNLLAGGINLNAGGFIRFPDGTAQATAFVPGGETNTYASSKTFTSAVAVGVAGASNGALVVQSTSTTPANPAVSVRANAGGELLRVQEDGRVGIGTGSGAGTAARLHVSSAGAVATDTVFQVSSGTATGQELLIVKGDGKVGIGGYVPNAALDVYRRGGVAAVYLQGQGDAWNYSGFNLWSDEATDKYWALYHRKVGGEANNLLLEEFNGAAYKQRMVMAPDGTVSFNNSTAKTQLELQGAGDAFNYTNLLFWNNDWTRYWGLMHRKAAGETNNFYLEEFDGSAYNVRLAVKPGGNVGVGTANPGAQLHLQGLSASTTAQIVQRAGAGGTGANLTEWRTEAGAAMSAVDRSGRIIYGGDTALQGAGISLVTGDAAQPGLIVRGLTGQTADLQRWQGAGATPLAVVTAAGNVGIGLASPQVPLHIGLGAGSGEQIRLSANSAAEGGQMTLMDGTGTGAWEIDNAGGAGVEQLRFFRDKGENNVTAMVISTNGNVGVGTTNPAARLDVSGQGGSPPRNLVLRNSAAEDATTRFIDFIRSDVDSEFIVYNNGDVRADGTFSGPADYAEYFRSDDATLKPGELVCVAGEAKVKRCAGAGQTLIGVVSTRPGMLGIYADDVTAAAETYDKDPRWVKVGLMGQIPTRFSAAAGAVKAGEQLTVGPDGAAVKGASPRTLLLVALEDAGADGLVRTLVK